MTKVETIKKGELEPAEKIDRIRRILVLEYLGIEVPTNHITGEVIDDELFKIELQNEEDLKREKNRELGIDPLFPLASGAVAASKITIPEK